MGYYTGFAGPSCVELHLVVVRGASLCGQRQLLFLGED